MPFIKVKDIDIYYEIAGAGPKLLYINGTGGDLRKKPNVFDLPLIEHFTVLAYDQRGLGQTSKPNQPYTMQGYANDAAALMDALGWEKAHVLGVSFGGMVAQELVINYPQKINKLVLACTSSGGAGGESYPLHELAGLSQDEKAEKVISLTDTRIDAEWKSNNPQQYQQMLERIKEGFKVGAQEPGRELGYKLQMQARKLHNTFERLPQINSDTYIAGGEFDGICSLNNLKAINAQIKKSLLKVYPHGHLFFMQDDNFWADTMAFIGDG